MKESDLSEMIKMIFSSTFQINEDSAALSLALLCLGLESCGSQQSVKFTFDLLDNENSFELPKILNLYSNKDSQDN